MNFAEVFNRKSSFLKYCANSSNIQVIRELDAALHNGNQSQFQLIHALCASPISSEIIFHLFDTVYSKLAFSKNSTTSLKVLQDAYDKCVAWHILRLSNAHVITTQTLTNYSNLFYLIHFCKISEHSDINAKNFQALKIDGIENKIAKVFEEAEIELTSETLCKFFVWVFHKKIDKFKKDFLKQQEIVEQKKRIQELLNTVKQHPMFKQFTMLKLLEYSIIFLILMKIFVK